MLCAKSLRGVIQIGFVIPFIIPGTGTAEAPAPNPEMRGIVTDVLNAGRYTYVQVDTGKEKVWVAAPAMSVKTGEKVTLPSNMMPMRDFHSKKLNRSFRLVYFTGSIQKAGEKSSGSRVPPGHPKVPGMKTRLRGPQPITFSDIRKLRGGKTVAELYARKNKLSGKSVKLRCKVAKVSSRIMGRNWLHIQDGTGKPGSNDLVISTRALPKVGDTVIVEGKLQTNKDFGFGYKYGVIIEDAAVTVE